jgi:hypothetical protein
LECWHLYTLWGELMNKPIIKIHNTEINEIIDREMTDDEFVQYEILLEQNKKRNAEIEGKAEAKETAQAKLAKLGLTVEDLTALGL